MGHTAKGFVAVEQNINLPRALCTLLVFWRIFDSIVLEDFQSSLGYTCVVNPPPPTLYTLHVLTIRRFFLTEWTGPNKMF